MLDVAHEVIIANLNSCEPHSCTHAHLDNISLYANPGCSKESQLLDEHQAEDQKKSAHQRKEQENKATKEKTHCSTFSRYPRERGEEA
jgi:hypothetical protein